MTFKNISLILIVLIVSSCGSSNIIFVPNLNKRVKVFKNDIFQMYYPTSWERFNMGQRFNDTPVLTVAPKKELHKVYRIKKYVYGKSRKIIISEKNKNRFPDYDFDDALKGKDAWAKVLISLKKGKLIDEIVTDYTSMTINNNRYQNFELSKISSDFYIISYRNTGRKRDVEYSFGDTINKIYLRQLGNDVYQVVYTASQYYYGDHKEDAGLILRSFKFIDD